MVSNVALEKLRAGQPAMGLSLGLSDAVIAEAFGRSGIDWIWIDDQHGATDRGALLQAIQVVGLTGAAPIVRVASNDFFRIGRALDAGALGVIVPMVNSAEEARAVVYAAKYPPAGGRSRGGARLFFLGEDYFEVANENLLVAVQIETRAAVECAEEIAAVEGIDCLMLGPADVALAFGVPPGSDEHEAALAEVLMKANAAGKPAGFPCGSLHDGIRRAEQGFKLVTCGSEFSMLRAGLSAVQEALGLASR